MLLNPVMEDVIACFRRGRGPGEVLNPGSVQIYDGRPWSRRGLESRVSTDL